MAVPLMARLDAAMLEKAHHLKVILQYGVGVEGVDIPAVSLFGPHFRAIFLAAIHPCKACLSDAAGSDRGSQCHASHTRALRSYELQPMWSPWPVLPMS